MGVVVVVTCGKCCTCSGMASEDQYEQLQSQLDSWCMPVMINERMKSAQW